jgi:hypothetical protein
MTDVDKKQATGEIVDFTMTETAKTTATETGTETETGALATND